MMYIKTINNNKIIEEYCKQNNVWAIKIPEFSYSDHDYDEIQHRQNVLFDFLTKYFGNNNFYWLCTTLENGYFLFDNESCARKLWELLNDDIFYNEEYSILICPQLGIIDENT